MPDHHPALTPLQPEHTHKWSGSIDLPGTYCLRCGLNYGEPEVKVDEERLRGSTDAVVWAEEFAKVEPDVKRDLMVAWFAEAFTVAESRAPRAPSSE